jgi:hypothetical protein
LLAYSQDVIDRLKTMPLGETPLERLLAQLRDQASDICCGDWVMPCDWSSGFATGIIRRDLENHQTRGRAFRCRSTTRLAAGGGIGL